MVSDPVPSPPYRAPPEIPEDPPPEPVSQSVRLGSLRSLHAAPALWRALVGPILITALVFVFGLALSTPAIALLVAAATLVVLAWSPLGLWGVTIALHAGGVVVSRRGSRDVVIFEDVDEVWFDIHPLHTQEGAYLLALRIVDLAGGRHRVPLAVEQGFALGNAVIRACSEPMLVEARRALAAGERLTFGNVQVDAEGIAVRGARIPWRQVRLVRVQPHRLALFGRLPVLPWRVVRLDRIPNPDVLTRLVAARARSMDRDNRLLPPS